MEFTFKEVYYLLKYFRKEEAVELDTRIKLAGDKKGYSGLKTILNDEEIERLDNLGPTDESSEVNKKLLSNITKIVQEGK